MNSIFFRKALVALITVLFILGSLFTPAAQDVRAAGNPSNSGFVARVFFTTPAQLQAWAEWMDIWEVQRQNPEAEESSGYVVAYLSSLDIERLKSEGIPFVIEWARTFKSWQPLQALNNQVSGIPGYSCYRTVEETLSDLSLLVDSNPNLLQRIDIGNSWEKYERGGNPGYDIFVYKLTNKSIPGPKPRFFLMAEIHAREYTTTETATRLIEYLLANYGIDPDITWLLDYTEIHVVPLTNPDGRKIAEGGLLQRKNRHNYGSCTGEDIGVDLNRNSSFHWGGAGSSDYPCDETYHGPSAQSELETRAIELYAASIFPDLRGENDADPAPSDYEGLFLTLHSYSELILFPYGFNASTFAPNHVQLQTLARKMAYYNGYTPEKSSSLYATTGSTDDWAYGALGVPAYTYEMGSEFFEECAPFESTIWPDNRDALLYAFKAARRGYQTPAGPDVYNAAVSASPVLPGTAVTLTASATDTRVVGGEATQNIQAARYSIDLPSWMAGAVTYPMSAADGSFNSKTESLSAVINTSGLSSGKHLILVESQDVSGNWGVPSAAFLEISAPAYALSVSADANSQKGEAGDTLDYALTIHNIGALSDSYNIQVTTASWATLPATLTVGPLNRNGSAVVHVSVAIPTNATALDSDTATLTVTSQAAPTQNANLALTSGVYSHDVQLSPASQQATIDNTRSASYVVMVNNTGETPDTFAIQVDALWTSQPTPSVLGPLQPGQSAPVTVLVTLPANAGSPDFDTATVTVSSQTYPGVEEEVHLITTAPAFGLTLSAPATQQTGNAGDTLEYILTLTNTGAISDTFSVVVSAAGWSTLPASLTVGPLASSASATLPVTVTIPLNALAPASDFATITVTSQSQAAKSAQVSLTSSVYAHGVQVSPTSQQSESGPSYSVTYTVTIANTGETSDSFDLLVNAVWSSLPSQTALGPLLPGESAQVDVVVNIPAGAAYPAQDIATLTARSQNFGATEHSVLLTTKAPRVIYLPAILR